MLHRIQRRDTFLRLRKPTGSSRHGCIGVKWVEPRPQEASPAYGFAIPRQYGSAVSRNRVRRQLRHLLADLDATASIRPGQYLISVRSPRADQRPDGDRLAHDLHLVMAKLGALEGDPNSGALITQERVQGTNG